MNKFLLILTSLAVLFLNGCADIPVKDGELVLSKDTTAGMENASIAKIKNQF